MRFHLRTLGCRMNQLDSARLRAALEAAGHAWAERAEEADWVVVNSCTVTAESDRKSRQAARALGRAAPRLAVIGCGPRAFPQAWRDAAEEALQFPGWEALAAHFGAEPDDAPFPQLGRTRVPVAVQTGCDDRCAFCITRVARGAHRSEPAARVVEAVQEALDQGYREVVLTGINLAAWGAKDTRHPAKARLHALLAEILARTAVPRIRLSSLGPQYLHSGFFELLAEPRVCDYLHLSVQSGAPGVLERMGRGHDARAVRRVAEAARRVRPDAALAADLIAGFPGETDAEHAETRALVDEVGFAKLHVFPFSPREGTPAAAMPGQVPAPLRKARAAELREDGRRLRAAFLASQQGKPARVLVEANGSGLATNYIRLATGDAPEHAIVHVPVGPDTLAESP